MKWPANILVMANREFNRAHRFPSAHKLCYLNSASKSWQPSIKLNPTDPPVLCADFYNWIKVNITESNWIKPNLQINFPFGSLPIVPLVSNLLLLLCLDLISQGCLMAGCSVGGKYE